MPLERPLTFTRWILDGHALGYPTIDDLDYHLTTLFPPVRPRGWLEIRYLDALPAPWWRVAATIVAGSASRSFRVGRRAPLTGGLPLLPGRRGGGGS